MFIRKTILWRSFSVEIIQIPPQTICNVHDILFTITITIRMFRGLSEEFGLVKEAEQQLLLYNIFIGHQLAAFQVRCAFFAAQQQSEGTDPGDLL